MFGHKSSILAIHILNAFRSIGVGSKGKQKIQDIGELSKIHLSNPISFKQALVGFGEGQY